MAKKRTDSNTRASRRAALKQLGAIALYGPALASMACSADGEGTENAMSPAGGGPGAGGAPGGGATPDAGGSTPGTMLADAGAAPTSGGNPSGGGNTDSGVRPGATDSGAVIRPDVDSAVPNDAGVDAVVSAMGDAGPSAGGLLPPMFPMASACTLTGTDSAGEGPFFIHEDEVMTDPTLNRLDIRDGKPGVEMHLHYRLLDQDGMCMKPIADVEVYTWHTDALGFYSGFANQNPDQTYMGAFERTVENGDRFCRGMQVTNAEGVASFKTVYPGWYFGRPIHIHFVALRKGSTAASSGTGSYRSAQSHIFTTQLYFEEQFSRMIHEKNAPYTMRTSGSGYTNYVKPNAQSMVRPTTRMEGNVIVASLNIITRASASRR